MNIHNSIILYMLILLVTRTNFVLPREYFITDNNDQTYMYLYHKLENIKEDIFPIDIRIKISMSSIVGTLFYSVDRNMNELIVSLPTEEFIEVNFNNQRMHISIYRLCECLHCRYQVLDLRIQINDDIQLQCNYGNVRKMTNENIKKANTNDTILIPNEAQMWLVNAPPEKIYLPNKSQIRGCIFSVWYNNIQIQFKNVTPNIGPKCIKSCDDNICNGGQCHDRYDGIPICDCATTFLNGRYCNDSISPINIESHSQSFMFDILKVSWRSFTNHIFLLMSKNTFIVLRRDHSKLIFEYGNADEQTKSEVILTDQYSPKTEYVCLINFQINKIDIRLFHNQSSINKLILTSIDLREEIFDSLSLHSGNGSMDIVHKGDNEYRWRKVNVIKYTILKNDLPVISIVLAGVICLLSLIYYLKKTKKITKEKFIDASSIDLEETKEILLDKEFDIHSRDNDGKTALHYACENGHDNIVKTLLDKGAAINCGDKDGWTALHYACANGHDTLVQVLLDRGSDISAKNNQGHSPWDMAREENNSGCINTLQEIINEAIQNGKNIDGWTQSDYRFIAAINQCNEDEILLFSDDVLKIFNNKYKSEMMEYIHEKTPLTERMTISINCLVASLQCQLPNNDNVINIINPLLEELHPHVTNNIAASRIVQTILYNLCHYEHFQTILDNDRIRNIITKYWSTENISEKIKLPSAVIICRTFVNIVIQPTVDPSVCQIYLCDILYRMETLSSVSYLGFTRQEIRDIIAKTRFLDACYQGDTAIVQSLLNQGVGINSSAIYKLSGLHYACDKGHCSTVQLLLDRGINISIIDIYNRNGLHVACRNGHDATVKLLLDRGIDINGGTENGQTGLHYACRNGHVASVQLLLDRGANIVPRTNRGETPWDMARRNSEKCLKCLENTILAAIENGKINDNGWSRQNYRFIASIKQCDEYSIATCVNDILEIFNNEYKSEMMERIHEMSPLTERMRISINCLVASLQCQLPNNDNVINIIASLMEELYPHIETNITAKRIVEMILYNLCQYKTYKTILDNERIRDIINKYWSSENISEEIKLSSTGIRCHNILDITMDSMSDQAVSYLSGIIQRMEKQRLDEYIGFTRQRIVDTIMKVNSMTNEGTDEDYINHCMYAIGWNIVSDGSYDSMKQQWIDYIMAAIPPDSLSQLRLERMYDAIKNLCDTEYWRNITVLFVHTRISVLTSNFEDINKSLQHLMALLYDKYKQAPCNNRHHLLECMMDLIEDVSNESDVYEQMNALMDAILSFVAYYRIIDNYNYERDLTFLESYTEMDTSGTVWPHVIMCAKTHKYVNMLTENLNNELINQDNVTKNMIIVYMAVIQCVLEHGDVKEHEWSNMDYQLIDDICKCDILTEDRIALLNSSIILIFNTIFKYQIFENIKNDDPLTESDKHLINCLYLSLHCESIHSDSNTDNSLKITTSLLEELYPYSTNDIVAAKIIEIILYNMCKDNRYNNTLIRGRIRDVCLKYWSTENINEEIKLPSAVIICLTTEDISEHCNIDEYVAYLCDAIYRMDAQRYQTYCGFSGQEIKVAVSKIAVTVCRLKNKRKTDYMERINKKIYEMINTIGIIIFPVDNFQANKTAKKALYSPYFYSHQNGYKLRLYVYPAGDAYDTDVSVYVFMCKGEYDDTLPWPCTLSHRLSIINQDNGEEYTSETIEYDPGKDTDTNKPTSEDRAYGLQKFISHSELQSIEGLIINDCILIKCDTF